MSLKGCGVRMLKCFVSFKSIYSTIEYIESLAIICKFESWLLCCCKSIHKVVNTYPAHELNKESSQIRQSRNSLFFNAYTKVRPKKVTPFSNYKLPVPESPNRRK